MTTSFERVTAFLADKKLAHHHDRALGLVRLPYQGRAGQWNVIVKVDAAPAQLTVYSLLPLKAPEALRASTSEAVQRANWGLPHGNFEFDVDDGELRFKTSAFVTAAEGDVATLEALLLANTATVDRYLPAFTAVIVQGANAREAIAGADRTPPA
jgi:hypothetical protein